MDFIKITSLILICILVSLAISIIALYDCEKNFSNCHISGFLVGLPPPFCMSATDVDCDETPNEEDNCRNVYNFKQEDTNNDGYGNVCDTDLNNDCITNSTDAGLFIFYKSNNNFAADFNLDGKIDGIDQVFLDQNYNKPPGPGQGKCESSTTTSSSTTTTTSTTTTSPCQSNSCKTLNNIIYNSYSSCNTDNYDPVADINKNGEIDIQDYVSFFQNCTITGWCEKKLQETFNPCIGTTSTTTIGSTSTTTTTAGSTSTTTTIASSTTTTPTILSDSEMSQSSTTTTISSTTTIIQGETTTKKIILKLSLILPVEDGEYQKGGSIKIIGNVKDDSGNGISNILVKIAFSGPGSWKRELKSRTDNSGSFYHEYPIGFGDPDGQWDLAVTADDNSGNQNTVNLKISVKSRPEMTYYTVNFLSPSANTTYKKGDRTSIQVEVRREDSMISNALVNCKSPTSSVFQLSESGNGMYSGYYDIRYIDSSGVWSITCEVQKIEEGKTLYGGSFINVKIDPANLKIDLINPKSNNLDYGKKTDFIVNLTYPDNEPVSSATVLLKFQGQIIALSEMEKGIYKISVQTKSVGIINASLNAKDINENTGNLEKTFVIKATMLGFLYINWYVLPLSIGSLISALFSFKYYSMRVPNKINNLEKKIQQIDEMRVSTEKEYFMRKIDEKTFKNLMENYKQNKLECQVILNELRRESEPISESNN